MAEPAPADGANFRRAMRQLPGAVTVVTAAGREGPAGVTATAVASVSAVPPVVLVVVDRWNWVRSRAAGSGRFAVNLLGAGQEPLAERFSHGATASFDGLPLVGDDPPLLAEVPVALRCRLVDESELYERAVLFGQVEEIAFGPPAPPLTYVDGRYRPLDG
ncbi:flavin reductase family protein [Patulibacter defluvii]|uniref:flavin reductase family protein n=1 Tax=Patulibacter defluvii TaxID=3095358 RepID=UPI002A763865|nr:flavin reductase family protein [Patulibacter sp. DM4]